MMFAGVSLGSTALASATPYSTAATDTYDEQPLRVYLNGVFYSDMVMAESLSIDDTLGEQTSCGLTVVNPLTAPVVGDIILVAYFSETLFSGTIDRIVRASNNTLTYRTYECTCTDWSQILVRRKILRNFINLPIQGLVDSLIDNELSGEGLSMGTADRGTTIPLVDSRGGSAFDVLRDAAGVTGQTFYVGFDKSLNFQVTSNPAAPLVFDTDHIETATLTTDRETYRNKQIVKVTGTPADSSDAAAVVVTETRQNDDQIAERAAIEGGSGIYDNVEEVTHPTSNATGDCQLLAIGYANLRLATSGVLRQTLKARVRNYGFRAGQFATVSLDSHVGATGSWLIQRVSIKDEAGKRLIHEVELVQSSLQQRAYESWLNVVKSGKITVQMPSALTNNLATYDTPTTTTWTVPAGVTIVEFTVRGGSGGGGGGQWVFSGISGWTWAGNGGGGGNSGKAVTILDVIEGQVFDLTIGAAGLAGTNGTKGNPSGIGGTSPTAGTSGTYSRASLSGDVKCQGNEGTLGDLYPAGADGTDGSGIGDAVTTGGGYSGGVAGTQSVSPTAGQDGSIEIRW